MSKILIIDDDIMVLQLMEIFLNNEGYDVSIAKSGRIGLEMAREDPPDLVILDLVMPVMDGFETYRRLRDQGTRLVIIMSNRQDEYNAVKALEMGADDYVRKPADLAILLAKIKNLLRRSNFGAVDELPRYDDGLLRIDLEERHIEVNGEAVKLTPTEFRLLSVLLEKVGRVVTHEELIKEVWGTEKEISLGSLKLYIHYLRQKIEIKPGKPHYLLAEWGVGYRFRELDRRALAA